MPSWFPPPTASSWSRPQTYATFGSARLRTSFRNASGAHVALASEKATTSASVARTAASCAATLPPRGLRITRTPAPAASSGGGPPPSFGGLRGGGGGAQPPQPRPPPPPVGKGKRPPFPPPPPPPPHPAPPPCRRGGCGSRPRPRPPRAPPCGRSTHPR